LERLERWVAQAGGEARKDAAGRIIDVFLGSTSATDADVEKLRPLADQIQRLDLSLTYVSDRGLEFLGSFTRLEELNLFAAEFITDAGLANFRDNQRLVRLNVRGTDITDVSMEYIGTMTSLRSLDVSFTQVNDTGFDHLAPLSQLEDLSAGGNKITGAGLQVLRLLPKLKSLDLRGVQRRNAGDCWSASVTDGDLELIGSLVGLETLKLGRGTGLSPGPRSEGDRSGNSESECRITGGIKVTDRGLRQLTRLKSLRSLDVSGSHVTQEGLGVLSSIAHLEYLSLWGCTEIGDLSAPHLAALVSLRELDLTDTVISDKGLDELAKAPALRRLHVSGTRVTAAGARGFQERNAACRLSWRSGLPSDPAE
jgi:Leucine-rich repeat (LRR) protein